MEENSISLIVFSALQGKYEWIGMLHVEEHTSQLKQVTDVFTKEDMSLSGRNIGWFKARVFLDMIGYASLEMKHKLIFSGLFRMRLHFTGTLSGCEEDDV